MTNLEEKKLDEFVNKKMESEAAKYNGWGTSARQAYIYGYTQAVADQQKKIEKLEKAVELMREGLKRYEPLGAYNEENDAFNDFVAKETLAEVDAILKEGKL